LPERKFSLSDFDYDLPQELIAQEPTPERGGSRLLVTSAEPSPASPPPFQDRMFSDLPDLLYPGDLLVLNSTRVRHARLHGRRPSGGPAEVLLIHPGVGDTWVVMGKPGSALRPGKRIALSDDAWVETVEVLDDGHRVVRFIGITAEAAMARHGQLPLPPYITHAPTAQDEVRYQTVYAQREGSVAAPTAGLHFTPGLLDRVRGRGVTVAELELEVGPGTFKPVETDELADHAMHRERFEIPAALPAAIEQVRARGGQVWAVGTTVVRALEAAADDQGLPRPGRAETSIFIRPGYRFRVVDGLVTNFHLPRSTLLMLVAALAGYDRIMAAYAHAIAARYRFYSYGDAMMIRGWRTANGEGGRTS
jgi:S-adenosylmethionine:tRNA ribosyltransferase-isomerase